MTIRQDAFTRDLGDDFVALDSRGHGVARASSLDALKAAAPGATSYFNASQLDKALNDEKSGRRKREEAPPTGTDPTIAATSHANPDASFEQAVVNADKHSPEGAARSREETVAKAREELARQRDEAGQPEPVNQTKSGQESLSPFDHDGDGKHGGSPKGENSTAARGRAARQRKPAK